MTNRWGKDGWLSGVIPVLPTPFTADGQVDWRCFDAVIAYVAGLPVTTVMYPGVASEHLALDDQERRDLTHRLLTAARDAGLRVVAAVTDYSTDVAIAEARALVERGDVSAVNVLPSFANTSAADLSLLYSAVA